jgi:hypothetical protein
MNHDVDIVITFYHSIVYFWVIFPAIVVSPFAFPPCNIYVYKIIVVASLEVLHLLLLKMFGLFH